MKKINLAALAAIVGLAFAAPSFAATGSHHVKTPAAKHLVKHKNVKPKAKAKAKLVRKHKVAKLHCAKDQKIAVVKGKQTCVAK